MSNVKKSLSCKYLQNAIYLAPDELRHCCQRFFVDGKMKGDVRIFKVNNDEDISVDKILKKKKELHYKINNGIENECTKCPHLTYEEWPNFQKLKLDQISFESHSVCNMKCSYCSEIYYDGKKPNYSLTTTFNKLMDEDCVSKEVSLTWGGGEPLLDKEFDSILKKYTENLKPINNEIYTNATIYSYQIEKYLKEGKVAITTSIDAGTIETFKKIRGVKVLEKVLSNLKKYYNAASKGIIIKYVLTKDNYDIKELDAFVKKIVEYGLQNCDFQISSDFKDENITDLQIINAIKLHNKLIDVGAKHCFFDYHLRPRIKNKLNKTSNLNSPEYKNIHSEINNFEKKQNIIIWGAGYTVVQMLKNSLFFNQKNINIDFIVDSDKKKQGKKIFNFLINHPKEIKKSSSKIFIASTVFYSEIYDQLIKMGINKKRIMSSLFF